MKLLRISASGLPLFKDKCEIDFFALQRVTADNEEKMSCIFSKYATKISQNNVLSFIGINASGKTTIVKIISFVCEMLNNQSLNNAPYSEILDGLNDTDKASFDVFFYSENETISYLHTVIGKRKDQYIILEETLKTKSSSKVTSKIKLFDFDDYDSMLSRDNNEAYLLDDVSIIVAFNKKAHDTLSMTEMLRYTNTNQLSISDDCPVEMIAFFDPSIEYLRVKTNSKDKDIRLKFAGDEEIILHRLSDLNRYLSSGTIKGINTFINALKVFNTGGYMIIDERENHFNREIVSTLIRFFMDKRVNPKGAMLIFSTHYAELLDEFERNDNIYIVRNRHGISAENLATLLKRNDIKKSEAYQSGYLEGTVPMYEAYMRLKKSLAAVLR
jgi:Fe-S cluster assembly ATPase SufC